MRDGVVLGEISEISKLVAVLLDEGLAPLDADRVPDLLRADVAERVVELDDV